MTQEEYQYALDGMTIALRALLSARVQSCVITGEQLPGYDPKKNQIRCDIGAVILDADRIEDCRRRGQTTIAPINP